MNKNYTIGIFDSGVGGFSVMDPLRLAFPELSMIYVADIAHVPYSNKTKEELEIIVGRILQFHLSQNVNLVIFACNTSSALILPEIRSTFPVPAFGVVDSGVEQSVEETGGKGIGVVANEVTARSGVFSRLIHEKNQKVPVYELGCPLLVSLVEAGDLHSRHAGELVESYCVSLRGKIDTLLLACTHFPFLEAHFKKSLPGVKLVDPAHRLIKQLEKTIQLETDKKTSLYRLLSTKDPLRVENWVKKVLNWDLSVELLNLESLSPYSVSQPKTTTGKSQKTME